MSVTYKVVAPVVLVRDVEGATHHVYQGGVLEGLDAEQVDHLLRLGFIAKVGTDAATIVPGTEFQVSGHGVEFDSAGVELSPAEVTPLAEPVSSAPVVDPPLKAAPVADWRAYAVKAHGVSEAEAAEQTKADLIELYG